MKVRHKTEIIAVGDELLNGQRANTHLVYLGEKLQGIGLGIHMATEVRDESDEMVAAFRGSLDRADLLIITGGLGPTVDDTTVACVAEALGRKILIDDAVKAAIEEFFRARNRKPTGNNYKQCEVIEGAEVLPNKNGTAPGQWIRVDDQIIVLLPGPPGELIPMFEEQVLPKIRELRWVEELIEPVRMRTMGIGESQVAEWLTPILDPYQDSVRVAYCAHTGCVDIRLSVQGDGIDEKTLKRLGEACRERLGEGFVAYGNPDVACLIMRQLRSINKSLAVAESCTGGLLSSRFTDIAGASKVFNGGVVCYNNEIKQTVLNVPSAILDQHGAVSAECAIAMATAVAELMESDYALAITGYAGPEGGNEPAGTVYLGYHSPVGVWSHKVFLPGNRIAVKERAVMAALDFLRRKLERYKVYDLLESMKC